MPARTVAVMDPASDLEIRVDDLRGPEIAALLEFHLECMNRVSPRESVHAFDLDRLCQPDVTFWSAWIGGELAGCGALKELDPTHGEVKSMRTAEAHLRRGVAARLLDHLIAEARRRGYRRLSLETGSLPYFEPARALYRRVGFRECGPFTGYQPDPNSTFFTLEL